MRTLAAAAAASPAADMEDIAVHLFKLGDREHKGFIVKRDMQRLRSEVELPPDQLEAVFESLDSSHNGYLTLDQFLAGVSQLSSDGESDRQSDAESDLSIERLLSLNVLHKSGELMCEVRSLLGREDTWHQLLAALFSDLNQLLRQISHLEDTIKARDRLHHEEIRRLYEELDSQICDQRDTFHQQMRQKEVELKAQFHATLEAKEQQIIELTIQRDQLQQRVQEAALPTTTTHLTRQQHQEVKRLKPPPSEVEAEQSRRRAELRLERSFAEGFRHAQHLSAIEEQGLVKQLRLIQEMQETLRSGLQSGSNKNIICNHT